PILRPSCPTLFPYTTLFRSWYYKVIGGERCPIVDTWWQTETGGIMITTLPGAQPMKPGSGGTPLPGFAGQVVNEDGSQSEQDTRSEEHTSELQSRVDLVCRL